MVGDECTVVAKSQESKEVADVTRGKVAVLVVGQVEEDPLQVST
jgi:hypothetical protein